MLRRITITCVLAVALAAAGVAAASTGRAGGGQLNGAGSSFVFPLVSQWKDHYRGATVNYNPIGSGGGIAAISNRSVDFGASDAPLSRDQFRDCRGCVQIPWALSATSVPYNLPGVRSGLRITGPLLADIYLGRITRWNDPRIAKLNRGARLPSVKITPIYRSDASGTTYNFTEYLSKVSPAFRSRVGKGTQVNFPKGVGASRSSGVAGALSRTEGGVTYVDVAYSLKNRFKFFKVRNRAGRYALPGLSGIKAAAATVKRIPANNELSIVDPPKKRKYAAAYPICTFTYVIVPLKTSNAAALRRFVAWALTTGQTYGLKLLFYPVPKAVRTKARKTLARVHA